MRSDVRRAQPFLEASGRASAGHIRTDKTLGFLFEQARKEAGKEPAKQETENT